MKRTALAVSLLTVASCAIVAAAQKLPSSGGTVTGHVLLGDSQLPARFAEVSLIRKPSKDEIDKLFAPLKKDEDSYTRKAANKGHATVDLLTEETGLDGAYTVQHVPPGDYWVAAKMSGYLPQVVEPTSQKEAHDLDHLMAAATSVHVEAERTVQADITLQRGGVITGRVQFEDGSPVVGVDVRLVPLKAPSSDGGSLGEYDALDYAQSGFAMGDSPFEGQTDDTGAYRVVSLPPDKYIVIAQLRSETGGRLDSSQNFPQGTQYEWIGFYAPGVFQRSAAKQFEIRADEVIEDADIKVDMRVLHTVHARVLVGEDHHVPAKFVVNATNESNPDLRHRGILQPDGSFQLDYLPAGTYSLRVSGAMDVKDPDAIPLAMKDNVLRLYEPVKVSVVVGDHDVTMDDILLVEKKPGTAKGND